MLSHFVQARSLSTRWPSSDLRESSIVCVALFLFVVAVVVVVVNVRSFVGLLFGSFVFNSGQAQRLNLMEAHKTDQMKGSNLRSFWVQAVPSDHFLASSSASRLLSSGSELICKSAAASERRKWKTKRKEETQVSSRGRFLLAVASATRERTPALGAPILLSSAGGRPS